MEINRILGKTSNPLFRLLSGSFGAQKCAEKPFKLQLQMQKRHISENQSVFPCPFCGARCGSEVFLDWHLKKFHAKVMNNEIKDDPMDFYKQVFGSKNIKHATNEYVRWPEGLLVTIDGQFKGTIHGSGMTQKNCFFSLKICRKKNLVKIRNHPGSVF